MREKKAIVPGAFCCLRMFVNDSSEEISRAEWSKFTFSLDSEGVKKHIAYLALLLKVKHCMPCKHKMTRGIGNLQEKPVSNESKLVMRRNLWLSFQLSSVNTLRVGVCSKELYWECFISRAANDWSTGFVWQLSLFGFDINRSANDWSTGFVCQLSRFGVDMINKK